MEQGVSVEIRSPWSSMAGAFFFDFRTKYERIADFYEEFLSPRASRGIYDLLNMGIIPKLTATGGR
jgi:hypothetical protein